MSIFVKVCKNPNFGDGRDFLAFVWKDFLARTIGYAEELLPKLIVVFVRAHM